MAPRPSWWRISYLPTRPESSPGAPAARSGAGSLMEKPGRGRRRLLHLPGHFEVVAPVAGPALLVGIRAHGDLLAVGDRLHAVRGHAQRDQVVVGRLGAPLAQRQVVLDGAALVAVALDRDLDEVELLERLAVAV